MYTVGRGEEKGPTPKYYMIYIHLLGGKQPDPSDLC